jgi:hypothetical protein
MAKIQPVALLAGTAVNPANYKLCLLITHDGFITNYTPLLRADLIQLLQDTIDLLQADTNQPITTTREA